MHPHPPPSPLPPAPCPPPLLLEPAAASTAPQRTHLAGRAVLGLWTQLAVGGSKKPVPRYEQAAAVLGESVFTVGGNYGEQGQGCGKYGGQGQGLRQLRRAVAGHGKREGCTAAHAARTVCRRDVVVGGRAGQGQVSSCASTPWRSVCWHIPRARACDCNAGGRYLGDVWELHLPSCSWSPVALKSGDAAPAAAAEGGDEAAAADAAAVAAAASPAGPALPPVAGHSLVAYGGKLYSVGGHVKVGEQGRGPWPGLPCDRPAGCLAGLWVGAGRGRGRGWGQAGGRGFGGAVGVSMWVDVGQRPKGCLQGLLLHHVCMQCARGASGWLCAALTACNPPLLQAILMWPQPRALLLSQGCRVSLHLRRLWASTTRRPLHTAPAHAPYTSPPPPFSSPPAGLVR